MTFYCLGRYMTGRGPSTILKSAGTVNSEASGSPRTTFLSWKVCSPIRGSLRLLFHSLGAEVLRGHLRVLIPIKISL